MRICRLVDPSGGKRVIDVDDAGDLGAERDIVAAQPARIPFAVPAFVMAKRYLIGVTEIIFMLSVTQMLYDDAALGCMLFHNVKLLGRQPAGFIQNGVGDHDLADIVQRRGARDGLYRGAVQSVGWIGRRQLFQQDLCVEPCPRDMLAGFKISVFNDGGKRVDYVGETALEPDGQVASQLFKLIPVLMRLNDIADTPGDSAGAERLINDVAGPHLEAALLIVGIAIGGDDDYRYRVDQLQLGHRPQDPETVKVRHKDIQQHDAQLAAVAFYISERLNAVACLRYLVLRGKYLAQYSSIKIGVIGDQHIIFMHNIPPETSDRLNDQFTKFWKK
ncbi:hypothetical protein SDC9_137920 [bioreactor metagenome]|uniref:Uncharacterized protein n=1 Tax=bioreactor metagenome TaxID=1076179 RepID=A0A645DNX3_9ZZZZ